MDYKLFLIPILVMVLNQVIKVIIEIIKGDFSWPAILSYGGMPSSHAALVTSLATAVGYYQGISSPAFAVSLIIAIIITRDASGIRYQLGTQGQTINKLIKELPDSREYHFPVLGEKFGHKNIEVFIGIVVGLVLTSLIIMIL